MKSLKLPKLYQWGLRYPKTVLILALLCTALGAHFASRLQMLTDFRSLLPQDTESVKNLRTFEDNFGSFSQLVVTADAPDADSAQRFLDLFAGSLKQNPEVSYVENRRPIEYFSQRQWLFLDLPDLHEVERRVERNLALETKGVSPAFSQIMDFADEEDRADLSFEDIRKKYEERFNGEVKKSSGESKTFQMLWVKPKNPPNDLGYNRRLMTQIKELELQLKKDPQWAAVQVGYAGEYQNSLEQVALVSREIAWVSTVVTLLLFAILILYFRRWSAAFLVGVPLACSVLWTMGLVDLLLGHLNLITGFGAAILAGLGSDYGIFLLTRYYNERKAGHDFAASSQLAFANTGRATFGSMVTTVGSFVALLFSKFGISVEFGIVGALGLIMNYWGMMLLVPALLALGERWKQKSWFKRLQSWDQLPAWGEAGIERWVVKVFYPKGALVGVLLTVVLLVAASFSLPKEAKVYFEDGQMDVHDLPSNRLYSRVSQANWGTLQPAVLLAHGFKEESETVRLLNEEIQNKPPEERVFHKILGVSSFIPGDQAEKKQLLGQISKKLAATRLVNPSMKEKTLKSFDETIQSDGVSLENLPEQVRRVFLSKSGKDLFAVLLYPSIARTSSENIEKYSQGIQEVKRRTGLNFAPVDSSFIQLDIIKLIESEAPRGLIMILLFFAGFLFITVRPAIRAGWIYLNLLASLVLLSGTLWLAHISLNVMNIAMIPIVLGTGIDCFIHFSHRYDEEGDLSQIIRTDIPAICVSSLTSIIGFGGLILTSSVGLRSVGWVAVLGLGWVTLLCALVFPRILVLQSRRRETRLIVPKAEIAGEES